MDRLPYNDPMNVVRRLIQRANDLQLEFPADNPEDVYQRAPISKRKKLGRALCYRAFLLRYFSNEKMLAFIKSIPEKEWIRCICSPKKATAESNKPPREPSKPLPRRITLN